MGVIRILRRSVLLLLLLSELIGSKKYSPSSNGAQKLSECKRCKILTESFSHWLDKTSRGKYEGGDAAWEEAKLKSYSRSEVRLVEIQEGLCSELKIHQDACYAIAEESEQVLEKWWFDENSVSLDLYTWLCIETLQQCCPNNHYGVDCSPCLQDKNNKICAGHGKCDGAGTRKGNGTCICKKGYTGVLCDECATGFYQTSDSSCKACHKACNGCSGDGAAACEACNTGWELQSSVCVDVDECTSSVCQPHQYCTNVEGSYNCHECDSSCNTCAGEGSSNCTTCEPSKVLWSGMCIDNELKQNILISSYKRVAFYIGLIIINLFISRHASISVASFLILAVAILIYIFERNLKFSTMDILWQTLGN